MYTWIQTQLIDDTRRVSPDRVDALIDAFDHIDRPTRDHIRELERVTFDSVRTCRVCAFDIEWGDQSINDIHTHAECASPEEE